MPYLIAGTITTIIGVLLIKTNTLPFLAAFIMALGIFI